MSGSPAACLFTLYVSPVPDGDFHFIIPLLRFVLTSYSHQAKLEKNQRRKKTALARQTNPCAAAQNGCRPLGDKKQKNPKPVKGLGRTKISAVPPKFRSQNRHSFPITAGAPSGFIYLPLRAGFCAADTRAFTKPPSLCAAVRCILDSSLRFGRIISNFRRKVKRAAKFLRRLSQFYRAMVNWVSIQSTLLPWRSAS